MKNLNVKIVVKRLKNFGYTARDHCPYCLYSKHLDIFPGDRKNGCKGLMKPIGYMKKKKGEVILYRCIKCNEEHTNIIAKDDNIDKIIELSTKPIERRD